MIMDALARRRGAVSMVNPWVNSCGLIENRIEICAEGQVCDNGTCVCNPMALLPPMCEDGRVVQSDGCGLNPTVVDTCLPPTDCIDGRCLRPNCEPLDEICDGTDNDCDGRLDEEAPCPAGRVVPSVAVQHPGPSANHVNRAQMNVPLDTRA